MRSNLIWMQSLTSHMYALVTVNHITVSWEKMCMVWWAVCVVAGP